MPDPADLTSSAVEIPEGETAAAVVLDDASSPTDLVRAATVTDPEHALDPMRWPTAVYPAGIFYPKKGDRATVVFPEGGDPVIIEWSPSAPEPDHAF